MGLLTDLLFLAILVVLVLVILQLEPNFFQNLISDISNLLSGMQPNQQTYPPQMNASQQQATSKIITASKLNQSQFATYALDLINKDRQQYGLQNVTLSTFPSAQQHAESMLAYSYFSHWDIYDMKPYMRYTLLGGNQSVDENVAYETNQECNLLGCTGNINPEEALQNMEYSMMYNDSICCNNGHRDNILDPNHNQVSIGIAYNQSTIYFVEDFIDDYITWNANSPEYANGEVYLDGQIASPYYVYQVYVSYDPPLQNLTPSEVPSGAYAYGQDIAGIVNSPLYYYQNITTIVANTYRTSGSSFDINFDMSKLVKEYGAGEYTVMMYMNSSSTAKSFIGSTYTIFINSSGEQYFPSYV